MGCAGELAGAPLLRPAASSQLLPARPVVQTQLVRSGCVVTPLLSTRSGVHPAGAPVGVGAFGRMHVGGREGACAHAASPQAVSPARWEQRSPGYWGRGSALFCSVRLLGAPGQGPFHGDRCSTLFLTRGVRCSRQGVLGPGISAHCDPSGEHSYPTTPLPPTTAVSCLSAALAGPVVLPLGRKTTCPQACRAHEPWRWSRETEARSSRRAPGPDRWLLLRPESLQLLAPVSPASPALPPLPSRSPAPPLPSVWARGAHTPLLLSSENLVLFAYTRVTLRLRPGMCSGWAGGHTCHHCAHPQMCELGWHTCVRTPFWTRSHCAACPNHTNAGTDTQLPARMPGHHGPAPLRALGCRRHPSRCSPGLRTVLKPLAASGAGWRHTRACGRGAQEQRWAGSAGGSRTRQLPWLWLPGGGG